MWSRARARRGKPRGGDGGCSQAQAGAQWGLQPERAGVALSPSPAAAPHDGTTPMVAAARRRQVRSGCSQAQAGGCSQAQAGAQCGLQPERAGVALSPSPAAAPHDGTTPMVAAARRRQVRSGALGAKAQRRKGGQRANGPLAA
eukprot:jgi/Tetstr1/430110/TSEL_001968.t1